MGVQFFGGKFFKCVDSNDVRISASIIPNKSSCLANGYQWRNSNVNFDNALNGFLALLQVVSTVTVKLPSESCYHFEIRTCVFQKALMSSVFSLILVK